MPLFDASGCGTSRCHGGMRPAADLDMSSATVTYAELVGVLSIQCSNQQLVAPGQPGSSYLVNKLTGMGMCSGSRMPKQAAAFTTTQVDVVRAWIGNGAPNN